MSIIRFQYFGLSHVLSSIGRPLLRPYVIVGLFVHIALSAMEAFPHEQSSKQWACLSPAHLLILQRSTCSK